MKVGDVRVGDVRKNDVRRRPNIAPHCYFHTKLHFMNRIVIRSVKPLSPESEILCM